MEYLNQPFKLKSSAGSEAHITLHLQLHFTKKIFGQKKVLNCHSDNISVISLGAESASVKKMSVISGGSVECLAQPPGSEKDAVTLSEIGKLESFQHILNRVIVHFRSACSRFEADTQFWDDWSQTAHQSSVQRHWANTEADYPQSQKPQMWWVEKNIKSRYFCPSPTCYGVGWVRSNSTNNCFVIEIIIHLYSKDKV